MHRKSAYILFLAVPGLLVIGIVMLFSTSAFARDSHGDIYFFIRRQAIWFGIGLVVCTFAALVDYHFWQRTWWLWFAFALVALALCYFPHIGMRINGSRRWVGLGPVTFQPSELAKVAAIFFLAAWFTRHEEAGSNLLSGFVLPLAIVGLLAGLILGEVDLGTTALLGTTAFVVMFVAGANPLLLGVTSLAALGAILIVATQISERLGRLSAFLHPQNFKEDAGLQQMLMLPQRGWRPQSMACWRCGSSTALPPTASKPSAWASRGSSRAASPTRIPSTCKRRRCACRSASRSPPKFRWRRISFPPSRLRTMRRRSPTAACSSSRNAPRSISTKRSRRQAISAPPPGG